MATIKTSWDLMANFGKIHFVTTAPNDTLVAVRTDGAIGSKPATSSIWTLSLLSATLSNRIAKSIARQADGIYIGITTNGALYHRTSLTSGSWGGGWTPQHIAMVTGNDGILIGVTDGGLQTSTRYDGPWFTVPNSGGMISATQLRDGTVLGIGKDNRLYSWDSLGGGWTMFSNSYPVISATEHNGRLVVVTTDNQLLSAEIVPSSPPAGLIPFPLHYSQKLKVVSETFTEVGNHIVISGSYELQFSDTEVRLDIGYLAMIEVEIPASVGADWKVTPKRVTRMVGTLTPGGQATRQFSFEQLVGKDELLHSLHSTRAFNDASIALSMKLRLVPTIQGGEITTADTVVLATATVPAPTVVITAPPPQPALPVIDTTDDLKGTITAYGENGAAEGKEKVFDNQTGSKWLCLLPYTTPTLGLDVWIQYTYAPGSAGRLVAYTLTSANDVPDRDPYQWELLGSNDGGQNWVMVDYRKDVPFSARLQTLTFPVSGSPTYKAYRLNISQIRNRSAANCVQLGGMELLGQLVAG